MKFSQPFTSYGTWDGYAVHPGARGAASPYSGGYVEFPAGSVVEVRTAISYVGVDGARANLAAEGAASFDAVRAAASSQWNAALSHIAVAGRDGDEMETFYTSLYRSLLHPNTFNDADGRYIGFDGVIHTVAEGRTQYTNFSDWDTYRCLAALQALLFPKQASDMAQSLVNDAAQSGSFPRWALANAATGMMTGDSVVPLIVNLYAYGAKDFDVKTALHYMVNAATTGGVGLNGYVERLGAAAYAQLGYAPEMVGPSASITLEWSVDDFAISRFADSLGDAATAAEFQSRAQYWQNLFNPTTHYVSPRSQSGFFPDGPGFVDSPTRFGQYGFDEGNAEQYVWWVPHNIAGLVTALGGRKAVADRLDRFTKKLNEGPNEPYLWAGNEPGFGVPWLYNYIGQPWKTQHTVNRVRGLFGPVPDGEPGNDDLGAVSSWYVWAALGLYPSTPGTPILTVSTPLFDRAVIGLPAGQSIRISAPGASAPSRLKYINGLAIDGHATDKTFLPESIIRTGGDLAYSLSAHPNKAWGTADSSAPPSFGAGSSAVTVNVSQPIVTIAPGSTATVNLDAQRMVDGAGDYTVTGTSFDSGITVAPASGQFAADGSAAVRRRDHRGAVSARRVLPGFPHHHSRPEHQEIVGARCRCPARGVTALDHVLFGQPPHHRPAHEYRNPAGEHAIQQNRRHGDGPGYAERGETTDQRRLDGTDTSRCGGGRSEGSADHRHDRAGDERRTAAEGLDAGPQRQRRAESRSGTTEYDQPQSSAVRGRGRRGRPPPPSASGARPSPATYAAWARTETRRRYPAPPLRSDTTPRPSGRNATGRPTRPQPC